VREVKEKHGGCWDYRFGIADWVIASATGLKQFIKA
jgi:hypothetical protein